jgi:hypothetical protein
LGALILASPDLACGTRKPSGTDAYDWMNSNMGTTTGSAGVEGFKTDNDLTKVMAGH